MTEQQAIREHRPIRWGWIIAFTLVVCVTVAMSATRAIVVRQGKFLDELEARGCIVTLANPHKLVMVIGESRLDRWSLIASCNDVVVITKGQTLSPADLSRLVELRNLTGLNLAASSANDESLRELRPARNLDALVLDGTQVTDAGLEKISGLTRLDTLHLNNTAVTDAGLKHLTRLVHLERLSLNGTAITDAGTPQLIKLTNLRELYLRGTKLTPAGVKRLKAALLRAKIELP